MKSGAVYTLKSVKDNSYSWWHNSWRTYLRKCRTRPVSGSPSGHLPPRELCPISLGHRLQFRSLHTSLLLPQGFHGPGASSSSSSSWGTATVVTGIVSTCFVYHWRRTPCPSSLPWPCSYCSKAIVDRTAAWRKQTKVEKIFMMIYTGTNVFLFLIMPYLLHKISFSSNIQYGLRIRLDILWKKYITL